MKHTLKVLYRRSGFAGRELSLEPGTLRLGREPGSEILFDEEADRVVSRHHAEIRREDGRWVLHPLPGKIVLRAGAVLERPTELLPGDVLVLAGPGGPSVELDYEPVEVAVERLGVRVHGSTLDGRVFEIGSGAGIVVGRAPDTAVTFHPDADRVVSARHCSLRLEDGRVIAEDLGSRNGLYFQGARVLRATLAAGERVRLGQDGPVLEILGWAEAADLLARGRTTPPTERGAPVGGGPAEAVTVIDLAPAGAGRSAAARTTRSAGEDRPYESTPVAAALGAHAELPPAAAPARTEILSPQVAAGEPPRISRGRRLVLGAVLVALLVGAGAGLFAWRTAAREQAVLDKVARVREALRLRRAHEQLTAEDWALYEQALIAEGRRLRARTPEALLEEPLPPRRWTAMFRATFPAEPTPAAAKAQAAGDEDVAPVTAEDATAGAGVPPLAEAQRLFHALKRAELERLTSGGRRTAGVIEATLEQYARLVDKELAETEFLRTDQVLRLALRHLGECDAAAPESFLALLRGEAAQLAALPGSETVRALRRAVGAGHAQTLTAALADQGLPVELLVLAVRRSGLDPRSVARDEWRGVARGMFQLLPAPAQAAGLRLGPLAESAQYDGQDERHRYELEARAAARLLRAAYVGPAAGSALLAAATFDGGDGAQLATLKRQAGLDPASAEPAEVSLWRLLPVLPPKVLQEAAALAATAALALEPAAFGLDFEPVLQHVPITRRSAR